LVEQRFSDGRIWSLFRKIPVKRLFCSWGEGALLVVLGLVVSLVVWDGKGAQGAGFFRAVGLLRCRGLLSE